MRRRNLKMCLDVLGMHGEVEEVWSGVEYSAVGTGVTVLWRVGE